ncbi:hypothetical protein VTN00DRAFT_364 [Thermoascus crustaceus]|uniref:uncharacterized protein n=1 Tax=Thermoascus crustaceus TaxID=5088 RepID=UPI003743DBD2
MRFSEKNGDIHGKFVIKKRQVPYKKGRTKKRFKNLGTTMTRTQTMILVDRAMGMFRTELLNNGLDKVLAEDDENLGEVSEAEDHQKYTVKRGLMHRHLTFSA